MSINESKHNMAESKSKTIFSKTLIIGMIVWLAAVIGGAVFCFNISETAMTDFYNRGAAVIKELANKNRMALLDYTAGLVEPSAFSIEIAEKAYESDNILEFAAILDAENKILVHTDADLIDTIFKPIRNSQKISTPGDVHIESGNLTGQLKIIGFAYDVTVSGAKVGKVYMVLNTFVIDRIILRYKLILGISAVIGLILLILIILLKRRKPSDDGLMIGPYRIKTEFADNGVIARGGMAELILGENKRGQFVQWVAIKRILPALIETSPEYVKLFSREAQLAVQLDDHPNIVKILDYYKEHQAIVMEYIEGKNLSDIFNTLDCPLPVDQSVFIILQVAAGLEYAHTKSDRETGRPLKIVHRDIKPSNIMVSYKGQVKISDFGIASATADPEATIAVGGIKGTLSYMSPEQAREEYVNNQSDIYSLGLVFHEMLVGNKVHGFGGDTSTMRAIMVVTESVIDPINSLRPDLPDELNAIVMKCLAKEKNDRYFSARELIKDLTLIKKQLNITYDMADMADFMKTHFRQEETNDFDKTALDASTVV
ncbi:serine/threonine-protein kinase [Desulfococcaceae bacterium HSG9]|nr:serine/threonine-protein kinase [Desulfococcaceae bacterium HSG9]